MEICCRKWDEDVDKSLGTIERLASYVIVLLIALRGATGSCPIQPALPSLVAGK